MNRFFKAYFIASLIYAVWFGVLMYAVDPMFGAMGCDIQSGDYLCFSGRLSAVVYQFPLSFPVRSDIQPFARCHHEVAQTLLGQDDLVFGRLRMAAIVGLDNCDAGARWFCVFPRCRYGADRFVFRRFAAAGHGVGANACHCHHFFEKPTQKRLIFVLPRLFWRNPLCFKTTPL